MMLSAQAAAEFQLVEQNQGGFSSSVFSTSRREQPCVALSLGFWRARDTALQERHDEVWWFLFAEEQFTPHSPLSESEPIILQYATQTTSHIGADQSSKQGATNKRPSCFGSNFPDWMSVRNVCVAAGRKVGHRLKAHCLAHIRALFYFYEILSERYDGLCSPNVLFVFHAH